MGGIRTGDIIVARNNEVRDRNNRKKIEDMLRKGTSCTLKFQRKMELQDGTKFQMPTREHDLHELETACQQVESGIKKIALSNGNFKATRELSANLDINKF